MKEELALMEMCYSFIKKIKFKIKDFDSVILKNQNNLVFNNGKWGYECPHPYNKFYGYELIVEHKKHMFLISLDKNYLPTEDEIIKMITSDRFKEAFNAYNKERDEAHKKMKSMKKNTMAFGVLSVVGLIGCYRMWLKRLIYTLNLKQIF